MNLTFSKQAVKDYEKLKQQPAVFKKAIKLLELLQENPLQSPPLYEKLAGDLAGFYSRRINIQHRLVYQIVSDTEVKILTMWSHYESL